jgi:hypothetical protein
MSSKMNQHPPHFEQDLLERLKDPDAAHTFFKELHSINLEVDRCTMSPYRRLWRLLYRLKGICSL